MEEGAIGTAEGDTGGDEGVLGALSFFWMILEMTTMSSNPSRLVRCPIVLRFTFLALWVMVGGKIKRGISSAAASGMRYMPSTRGTVSSSSSAGKVPNNAT